MARLYREQSIHLLILLLLLLVGLLLWTFATGIIEWIPAG
jgi:hypothetical protein